ncbi:MAG: type II toxin-antitoxin system RelE/ParE family toxin [Verrucomicrobia bacterium]|nr:type II toxin-antitoxin system RelE/ParE family toxin [Verrucomicrobiota bacterium]
MAQVVWAEPALQDLDAITDYIALDDPTAATGLVRKVFERVDQLVSFPETGTHPRELKGTPYRKLTVRPVLIYYRLENQKVIIVHVVRGERKFSLNRFEDPAVFKLSLQSSIPWQTQEITSLIFSWPPKCAFGEWPNDLGCYAHWPTRQL